MPSKSLQARMTTSRGWLSSHSEISVSVSCAGDRAAGSHPTERGRGAGGRWRTLLRARGSSQGTRGLGPARTQTYGGPPGHRPTAPGQKHTRGCACARVCMCVTGVCVLARGAPRCDVCKGRGPAEASQGPVERGPPRGVLTAPTLQGLPRGGDGLPQAGGTADGETSYLDVVAAGGGGRHRGPNVGGHGAPLWQTPRRTRGPRSLGASSERRPAMSPGGRLSPTCRVTGVPRGGSCPPASPETSTSALVAPPRAPHVHPCPQEHPPRPRTSTRAVVYTMCTKCRFFSEPSRM